jgi:hypothetical protein
MSRPTSRTVTATTPGEVAAYVASLGAAGVNIEDSTAEVLIATGQHAAKIAAIKLQAPDVFVNARVDNYRLGQDAAVPAVLSRAAAYVDAGADGIFVPSVTEPADLEVLAAQIPVPVNVLVVPALTLSDMARLGVRRVSTGSLPYRAAIDAAVAAAAAVRDDRKPRPRPRTPKRRPACLSTRPFSADIPRLSTRTVIAVSWAQYRRLKGQDSWTGPGQRASCGPAPAPVPASQDDGLQPGLREHPGEYRGLAQAELLGGGQQRDRAF